MQYKYTCEGDLPVTVTLTYEDILVIRRMIKQLLSSDDLPMGLFRGDLERLQRETRETLNHVHLRTQWAFPKFDDETSEV